MTPAAFLDRDGTIIELVHHLADPADVRLIPGAGEAIARLNARGWPVVVVTNQSVIGRGKLTVEGLEAVHAEMNRQLAHAGARVDDIRYCPLAPTIKDPTIIEDLMRKPGPGMLLEAAHTLGLHLAESWMVGDTVSDMLAGRHAGTRTILVETGYGAAFHHDKASVDHVVADLSEAVARILNDACG